MLTTWIFFIQYSQNLEYEIFYENNTKNLEQEKFRLYILTNGIANLHIHTLYFFWSILKIQNTRGPPLTWFSLPRIPLTRFLAMYLQVGDLRVSRGPPTVPLTQISGNALFFESQNPRKAFSENNTKT